jgi:hypothetical protein
MAWLFFAVCVTGKVLSSACPHTGGAENYAVIAAVRKAGLLSLRQSPSDPR